LLIDMGQSNYEFAIDGPNSAGPDKEIESSFGLGNASPSQRRMNFVSGKIRIGGVGILGGGPEIRVVVVPESYSRQPAPKMQRPPAVKKRHAGNNRGGQPRVNCAYRDRTQRAAPHNAQLMENARTCGQPLLLRKQSVCAHRQISNDRAGGRT
jgi:hypothetical protein